MKNIFGYSINRYRGLAKNDNKNSIMYALTNIYMVAKAERVFEPIPITG